jgi:hypothetical protein
MQYKLYVDNATFLPELPDIERSQIYENLVGVDVPLMFAVGGQESFFERLGLNNLNATSFCTDSAIEEKLRLVKSMLPALHQLQDKTLKEEARRVDAEAASKIIVSSKEKDIVEGFMLNSSTKSKGGCIVWIMSAGKPNIDLISPEPFNIRQILSQQPLDSAFDKSSFAYRQQNKQNGVIQSRQSKLKAAIALRLAAAKYVLGEVKRSRVSVVERDNFIPGKKIFFNE